MSVSPFTFVLYYKHLPNTIIQIGIAAVLFSDSFASETMNQFYRTVFLTCTHPNLQLNLVTNPLRRRDRGFSRVAQNKALITSVAGIFEGGTPVDCL